MRANERYSHLRLKLGVERVGAAAEKLPDGGSPLHAVLRGVVAVLAPAGGGADQLAREALAVPAHGGRPIRTGKR